MALYRDNRLWERRLDPGGELVKPQPNGRAYPASLTELGEALVEAAKANANAEVRVTGSHWAPCAAAVTRGVAIDTNAPPFEGGGDAVPARLNRVLHDVVPHCLSEEAMGFFMRQTVPSFNPHAPHAPSPIYLFHVEAGMRIYELYAALDAGDVSDRSLAAEVARRRGAALVPDYGGPWAPETLGGAGGQTIVGAISTGTHGGDVHLPPIADSAVALHLVDQEGREFWIERTRLAPTMLPGRLTDADKLCKQYPRLKLDNIYQTDDDLFNAAVLAVGRFGAIYSVVFRAVRQYALEQRVTQETWTDTKAWLATPNPVPFTGRFCQIVLNPYSRPDTDGVHSSFVTTRILKSLAWAGDPIPLGRPERGGANAGRSAPLGKSSDFSTLMCSSKGWIHDALLDRLSSTKKIRETAAIAWVAAGVIIAFPLTPLPVRLAAESVQAAAVAAITWATSLIYLLGRLLDEVLPPIGGKFGETLATLLNSAADHDLFWIVQLALEASMKSDQEPGSITTAISYAAMDKHNYLNVGCVSPGESIEIFTDASDPLARTRLSEFIDLVLARVGQLWSGALDGGARRTFGGYIALRFTGASEALLAMQQWPITCSIEIAGLRNVEGTIPLLRQVEADAKERGLILHWGQRNELTQADVEARYGASGPSGRLFKWRRALSQVSAHGRLALFSTAYTRDRGLEITVPEIKGFRALPEVGCVGDLAEISWDAIDNPPETEASLIVRHGGADVSQPVPGLSGSTKIGFLQGRYEVDLRLRRPLVKNVYEERRSLQLRGISAGDTWLFRFTATARLVDGLNRWAVSIVLGSSSISNSIRVAEVRATIGAEPSWVVRTPGVADVKVTSVIGRATYDQPPVFNREWLIFADAAAIGAPPAVEIEFVLTCG